VFSEIALHVLGQLRLQQFIGIVLFVAGLCAMANHMASGIHEIRESSTWSTSPAAPASSTTNLYRRV
jgi:hypothetical protein